MNWDAAGAIGEIVGAVAVVATLTYLAVQIRTARIGSASEATYSALEAYSRWRANILQNSDIAEAVAKANRAEALTDREQLQLRMLTDELFAIGAVGASESEGWGSLDRRAIDVEYLKVIFEENPGLVPHWHRYHRFATFISDDYARDVDELLTKLTCDNEPLA
jgi:hypothetical protein